MSDWPDHIKYDVTLDALYDRMGRQVTILEERGVTNRRAHRPRRPGRRQQPAHGGTAGIDRNHRRRLGVLVHEAREHLTGPDLDQEIRALDEVTQRPGEADG